MKRTLAALAAMSAVWLGFSALPKAHAADHGGSVELRVLGSNQYVPGTYSCLRVVSYNPSDGHPVANVPVEIHLQGKLLFSGLTNQDGTVDGRFLVPSTGSSSASLQVSSPRLAGIELTAPVTMVVQDKLYLTTDKPLYQPGQTVHVRMLGLHAPQLTPLAGESCHLQITDPHGNVVFKTSKRTSRFGVVSAQFDLASEVNMGDYRLQASCGSFSETRSFTVKRYVLPKFKVGVTTDKSWYEPAEHVHGRVQAAYFFGKPVAHARIALHVKTFDVSEHVVEELEGTTDANGDWSFDFVLPPHFTARPLDHSAPLDLVAEVVDSANHKETGPLSLSVVSNPISVELFPEAGHLVPNLSNRVYVVAAYPDGRPAECQVSLRLGEQRETVDTDATGFAAALYTPKQVATTSPYRYYGEQPLAVSWNAVDKQGNVAHGSNAMTQTWQTDSLLLHLDRALYRVGDRLAADAYSTRATGTVYVDLVRDNQTVLTQSLDVANHRGHFELTLGPDSFGTISLHAYQIGQDQNIVRDTRKIFVQPARDLTIEVHPDQTSYRPGQEAHLHFVVKTADGAPRLAVLGVDMVDESLFALADREPGLEKVYFLLEKAMLEPRYEVHGFALKQAVEDDKSIRNPEEQNLSRALFSKVDPPAAFAVDISSYTMRLQTLQPRFQKLSMALSQYAQHHGGHRALNLQALVDDGLVQPADIVDPWGHAFDYHGTALKSVGPDGVAGTADDVTPYNIYTLMQQAQMPGGVDRDFEVRRAVFGRAMPPGAEDMAANAVAPVLQAAAKGNVDAAPSTTAAPPRIRQYFPETLYSNPEVVTDENGQATVTVPLADSITSWRVSAFGSSIHGELGNANAAIKVFQPFFVDIDMPPALTQNDDISVPVAVYNYLPEAQTVTLNLAAGPWFSSVDGGERTMHLTGNEVTVTYFRIHVTGVGSRTLTVSAQGTKLSDAVRRSVQVEPDGAAFDTVMSDRMGTSIDRTFMVPKDAIGGASKLLLTVYPGVFAQVMEGMDAIFRMPNGCFEQTSSTTFPNVLVMDYLKKVNRLSPETQMKAEGYINTGYQRLLTFEVKGGGFSVFGQAPANPILTAYGLMEFSDMAKVHDIDPNLIDRTRTWLLAQQQPDGSWSAGHEGFYAEGWSNVPNCNLVSTAYITWALLSSGAHGSNVDRAVAYIREHMGQATEPYTTALVANALVDAHDPLAEKALTRLAAMEVEDKDAVYWPTRIATAAFGSGAAGDIETTALATLAMEGSDRWTEHVNRALTYLTRSKDQYGTWASTQATVLAMKALVGSIDKGRETANASIDVVANGKTVSNLKITPETSDVYRQIDLTPYLHLGENDVHLAMSGKGNCQYKLAGTVYRPWSLVGTPKKTEPLGLTVSYDRTHLSTDDTARCTVSLRNQTSATANQVVIDVGIPPGFEVHDDDLATLVQKQVIAKYSNTGRQLIIYLEKLDPNATVTIGYEVKARFPIRAQVPSSSAYEYYDPSRQVRLVPSTMVVTR